MMPRSKRTDGKYNRQAQYFLISVKERNMDEFLDTLKKERKRHAEPYSIYKSCERKFESDIKKVRIDDLTIP